MSQMGAKSQWPNAMPWGAKRASTPCAGKTGAKRRHQLLEPSKARDARLEGCRERAVWQNGECGAVRIAQLRRIVRRHGAQRAVHSAIRGALAHVDRGGVQDAARRPIHPPAARPTGTGLTDSISCANASHAAPCRCHKKVAPPHKRNLKICTPCGLYACPGIPSPCRRWCQDRTGLLLRARCTQADPFSPTAR